MAHLLFILGKNLSLEANHVGHVFVIGDWGKLGMDEVRNSVGVQDVKKFVQEQLSNEKRAPGCLGC